MSKQLFALTIIVLFLLGCKKDLELKKSTFKDDPEFAGLPAYSEWGYNTFGSYYDRYTFISNNTLVPAKIVVSTDTMSFILDGQQGETNNSYNYSKMSITFKLKGFSPAEYTDLTILNDTALDLKNPSYQVLISIDTLNYAATILSGNLFFKRAQNLLVDKEPVEVILSGYFDFKAVVNNKPVTISDGRFDVGISPDNFYIY